MDKNKIDRHKNESFVTGDDDSAAIYNMPET